jgi:protoporphyrinogen oxidase
MKETNTLILGAGMTGLAAGWASGLPIYEAQSVPGGICSSYCIRPHDVNRLYTSPEDGEAYRFEIGGGHWIFGGDPVVLHFIQLLTPVKSYERNSSVFFSKKNLYVPYPIQNHLGYLDKEIASKALTEIITAPKRTSRTMSEWLEQSFGPTLLELFFAPFHEKYTAGLWTKIAPQDAYKSPINIPLVIHGAFDRTPPVGYNATYIYPQEGLNTLAQKMARRCNVHYGKRVAQIDVYKKEVLFTDGSGARYNTLISTLPLSKTMEMTGLELDERPDCYTSVLVLNIGAKRGAQCPDEHWLYIPDTDSGFHRVGFYSNVDTLFLPRSSQMANDRVSIYVERAYWNVSKPLDEEIRVYSEGVIKELQSWGFIEEVEVIDPTWIEVAYTWSWPSSRWRVKALKLLEKHNVYQIGRYGRWVFQGIAESIKDGLFIGAAMGNL